jgi:uncharacterized protein
MSMQPDWQWSPYAAGAGIGILSWLAFLLSNRFLACSASFARTAGMIERVFRGGAVEKREYYLEFPLHIDWEWMLVAGMFLGALLSSVLAGGPDVSAVPVLWAEWFGGSALLRIAASFAGGLLMGFGARWAGGCTSGHGISGTLQLAVSSWIAVILFFGAGILSAALVSAVAASMGSGC